jgi:hypothetical protein
MIYVSQIYDTLLAAIRKDKRGLSFSPDDYNNILPQVVQRIYRKNYSDFESSKLSMDEMDSRKVPNYPINLVNGIGILPSDYFHLVGDPYYIHPTLGRRRIDLITSLENGQREMDYYTKASASYPTCFMAYGATSDDMSLYVNPTTCTPIYIDYLKKPIVPFLDYYTDANLNVIYMAEGVTVTIPLGSQARNRVTGINSVVSLTKNFDFHEHDIPAIVNNLLESVGVSLPDEMLVQVSAVNDPKIEKA